MQRVSFVLQVKPALVAAYRAAHASVWPEMQAALTRAGWHNYTLFLCEDGLLFGYFETPQSFDTALAMMANEPVNARRQAMMAPYFEVLDGVNPDRAMEQLVEVFHLE